MSKSRGPFPFLTFIFLLCIAWLVSPIHAQAQVTNYGCYIASPPHSVAGPGDVRIVSGPSDCISGETWVSWEVFPAGVHPGGITFDGTHVWVVNNNCHTCPGSVTKLRASDGVNLGTFPAGQGPAKAIFDGTHIWITNRSANTLTKLRASDGGLVATIPVRQGPAGLAFDGNNIWVSYYLNNSVSRIRPSDGGELTNTPGVSSPLEVLYDGTHIWAANNTGGGKVTKINASTGAIMGVFNTNGGFPSVLAFDGGNVWVPNSGTQNLSKIRASDGAFLGSVPMGFGSSGITFDGTNMWLANNDVVLKFRTSDGALLGSFPGSFNGSGQYTVSAVFDGSYVWVANYTANTVTRYRDGTFDSTAPTTIAALSPSPNTAGWNNADANISLSASDNVNGSGVSEITYCATGAQTIPCMTVSGDSANLLITAEGETTISYFGKDNTNNSEVMQTLIVKIDKSAPYVSCGSPDGAWHASDVAIPCSFDDGVSGLEDSGEGSFHLTTSVAANTETANASTDSRTVCDVAGNCSTAGPVDGNKVDKKAPTITITTPSANAVYLLNQSVSANYTCTDGGSGVASCTGTVVDGGRLDTATAGAKTFTVNATDNAGNNATPSVVNYTVTFGIEVLFDQTKAHKSGSTVPVKIRLVDANGVNVSSSATIVHAISVVQIGTQASTLVEDAGNANPDLDFRYDQSLDGYIFNLKTTGYGTGSYLLNFVVGHSANVYSVGFQVRQ